MRSILTSSLLALFSLLHFNLSAQYVQSGAAINGEAANDRSGSSVSISGDGQRLAIGAPANFGSGVLSGHVRVYDRVGANWVQAGNDIDGEAAFDGFGDAVSLSLDGQRIAVGAGDNDGNGSNAGHVRVLEWNGSDWVQMGADLDGAATLDNYGSAVAISDDGGRVAIGGFGNNSSTGHVRIFEWNGSNWAQMGSDLVGDANGDQYGWSVALSGDGSRLAIGAKWYDGNGGEPGLVRVWDWNGTSWTQTGADLYGELTGDNFGFSVDMSTDGMTLAVGAPWNDGTAFAAGHVRVFDWDGSSWTQIGADIDGEYEDDKFAWSLSLSANGQRVAIGSELNDDGGTDAGHVRVYDRNGGSWIQVGSDIDGEAAQDRSGISVSLSMNGQWLAIGSPNNDGNGTDAGHVRVYEDNSTVSMEEHGEALELSFYPNPVNTELQLNFKEAQHELTIAIHDMTGRTVLVQQFASTERVVLPFAFPSGMYHVVLHSDVGSRVIKVMKE